MGGSMGGSMGGNSSGSDSEGGRTSSNSSSNNSRNNSPVRGGNGNGNGNGAGIQRRGSTLDMLRMINDAASGTVRLLSGETVYNQGDIPSSCFIVLKGSVCGFVVDSKGSHGSMLFEAGPGSILGGVAVSHGIFIFLPILLFYLKSI